MRTSETPSFPTIGITVIAEDPSMVTADMVTALAMEENESNRSVFTMNDDMLATPFEHIVHLASMRAFSNEGVLHRLDIAEIMGGGNRDHVDRLYIWKPEINAFVNAHFVDANGYYLPCSSFINGANENMEYLICVAPRQGEMPSRAQFYDYC